MAKTIFAIIFILTLAVRLAAISGNNLPFTTDQGRDMIDIRQMVVLHKPRLIGPTTSINGVYLGPFWYYFNLPAFIIGGGHPAAILIWQIASYQIGGLLIYLVLKKDNPMLAFLTGLLFLVMPVGFNTSRYSWNANAMPIFTALFLLAAYLARQKPTLKRLLLLGITAGIGFQVEAAFGVIFFPFSFLYLLSYTKKLKPHLAHLAGFLLTLAPQAVFELRHQFPLTRVVLSEFSGQSSLLGEKLALAARLADRQTALTKALQEISHLPTSYLFPLFAALLILTIYLIQKKKVAQATSAFFRLNLSFVIFAAIFYLLFRQPLKNWYLLGLSVPLLFIYAAALTAIAGQRKLILKISVTLLILLSLYFYQIVQAHKEGISLYP